MTIESRSNATSACADPSSTVLYWEGYSPGRTAHMLQQHSNFVNSDSLGEDLQLQSAMFRAWSNPQTGTASFWRLQANSGNSDYVFAMSSNNNPPVVSGFSQFPTIIAYVYPSQVCDSVPLFVLFLSSATDHYYTIDTTERQNLITLGWADQGIAAYVLPA
ncbi:hypothetical protein CVT25_007660 [Psilocybe cyanescens]|uniref:DUF5648 domain-containing protein n=1 Tax=Psilocybe cyanescens TaxID=93625 RepID=A0A409VWA6_PSICY|nr:hypothetical protein CVT25_007660 [Psilocybe cyanescens]